MKKIKKLLYTIAEKQSAKNIVGFLQRLWQMKFIRILLLSTPVALYYLPILLTGEKNTPGDPDYYFALYEAFRRSVIEFGQFPWWDPWIAGGVPLFANIQFGLISITSLLVLLFGAPLGIKLSLALYGIIGFFGARRFFVRVCKTPALRGIALAYIFVFCGFFAVRATGHYTFPLAALTPWILYFFIYRDEKGNWWKLGAVLSLLILTSPHYIAIMTCYLLLILFAAEAIRFALNTHGRYKLTITITQQKARFQALLKAAGLVLLLCTYRMYMVYNFFKDHKRELSAENETFTGFQNAFLAMWQPVQLEGGSHGLKWGWMEITSYIGITTFVAICLIIAAVVIKRHNIAKLFSLPIMSLLALFGAFILLGMGDFGPLSPYVLAQHLPLFDSMRVATRWIFWAACIVLIIIACYQGKKYAKTITLLCFIAVIDLLTVYPVGISRLYDTPTEQYRDKQAEFYQERYNHVPRPYFADKPELKKLFWYDENLYETTRNNVGQVFASDSLLYKTAFGETIRCAGYDNRIKCPLVRTNNATVTYWSPNKIELKRTGPGIIELDMNPGKGWRINNKYPFALGKSVDPLAKFEFGTDSAQSYTIEYVPKFSPGWFIWKITKK